MQKIKTKDLIFVLVQLFLFTLFVFSFRKSTPFASKYMILLGYALAIIGIVFIALAVLQLNKNLTVFPTPLSHGKLITNGVYALVRHPIYSGIIALCFGISIIRWDIFQAMISGSILILFIFKSDYEERLLEEKFSEYKEYIAATGKLFPKFF